MHDLLQQSLPTTTTIMNSFDFITSEVSTFTPFDIYTDYDFSDVDFNLITTPELLSPTSSLNSDWLDAIPVQEPIITSEPPSSATNYSNSEYSTISTPEPLPMEEDLLPAEEPTPQPLLQILDIDEAINFRETLEHHHSFARQSLGLHGVPRDAQERFEDFEDYRSDEIYRLLFFCRYFKFQDPLTEWQTNFLKDFEKRAAPNCIFCKLPKNYWCEKVATNLVSNH